MLKDPTIAGIDKIKESGNVNWTNLVSGISFKVDTNVKSKIKNNK